MSRSLFVLLGIGFLLAETAHAAVQAAQLPEDGWWIRYSTKNTQKAGDDILEVTGKLTYSLVGTVVEDGEQCRWLELHAENDKARFNGDDTGGRRTVEVVKFLVPEKELLENEYPLDKLKRGWGKITDRDVYAIKPGQLGRAIPRSLDFPGAWQDQNRIEKERVIDFQQGRLKISEAKTRKTTFSFTNSRRTGETDDYQRISEYTVWFDRTTSPFFSAMSIHREESKNGDFNLTTDEELVLEDYGTGAKSKLPDHD